MAIWRNPGSTALQVRETDTALQELYAVEMKRIIDTLIDEGFVQRDRTGRLKTVVNN